MQNFQTITGVIRLRLEGISYTYCEARYRIGSSTAQYIMSRYGELGKSLDELMAMTPADVETLFYPPIDRRHLKIELPDFAGLLDAVHVSRRRTFKTELWEEYRRREPKGFRRTQFFEYLNRYLEERFGPDDLSMGVNRIPGERIYIDYCGDKAHIHIIGLSKDPYNMAEVQEIHLFLTTCGFSSRIYAEPSLDEKQEQFNMAVSNAILYYGAVPKFLVPDNLKAAVSTNTKDGVVINSSFQDLESFYETIVLPPPYSKPHGKPTAERYVKTIQDTIIKALEKQFVFNDFDEVRSAVNSVVEAENNQIPRGYTHTHNELFELYDKPAMKPLKDGQFLCCDYAYCSKVPGNYHVRYDNHYYSVPNQYHGAQAIIKATRDEVIICDINNREIARHKRCYLPELRYITKPEHMPASHRYYAEVNSRSSEDYLKWAEGIGDNMRQLVFRILKSAKHDEQMYSACNSILHLCDGEAKGICEEAAAVCIREKRFRYHDFQSTLSDLLKNRKQSSLTSTLPQVEEVRGKDYYK